jgi:hypothetical protein
MNELKNVLNEIHIKKIKSIIQIKNRLGFFWFNNIEEENRFVHTGASDSIWPNLVFRHDSNIKKPAYIFPTVNLPVFS